MGREHGGEPFSDLSFIATLHTDDQSCASVRRFTGLANTFKSSMDIKEVCAKAHICEIILSPRLSFALLSYHLRKARSKSREYKVRVQ